MNKKVILFVISSLLGGLVTGGCVGAGVGLTFVKITNKLRKNELLDEKILGRAWGACTCLQLLWILFVLSIEIALLNAGAGISELPFWMTSPLFILIFSFMK